MPSPLDSASVVTMKGDNLTGYAEFRHIASTVPPPNFFNLTGPFVPPLPSNGTV
jgi:hypothetical protein